MPETARAAPPPTDLAGLIPAQRAPEPAGAAPSEPAATTAAETAPAPGPAPERLAFLWAMLGATTGAIVVAAAFLVLLTLLP